jgi:hypothetical protein
MSMNASPKREPAESIVGDCTELNGWRFPSEIGCSLPRPCASLKAASNELGSLEGIGLKGRLSLRVDGGRDVGLDPRLHPHLDHGYAITSHSRGRRRTAY